MTVPNTSKKRKVMRQSRFAIYRRLDSIRKYEDVVNILFSGGGKTNVCMYEDASKCKIGRNCWECWRKFIKDNEDVLR